MAQTIVGRLAATLDLDVRRFNQGLRSADVGIRVFERSVGASSAVIKDFATLAGGIGLTRIAGEAIMAGESMISLERRLNVMSNSMQKMGIEGSKPAELMTFLSTEADRMAFDFSELTKTFTQLVPAALATGLAFDEVKNVLTGTIGMANLMGASAQEMARAFVAIRQVIGKDRLQMEELRQQLGEAMPNSMVIVAEGLNQINKETGELGENLKITTASLNAMIQAGKIDGELFVRAWSIGTARAREFAEARSMMLSGQMTIARNIFERDVGTFMNQSGVNNFLAALTMEFNRAFRGIFMDDTAAKSFGDSFRAAFESLVGGATRIYDEMSGIIPLITGIFSAAFEVYRGLPDEIKAAGLIGFMMFGKKGKAGIIGIMALAGSEIDSFIRGLAASVGYEISAIGGQTSESLKKGAAALRVYLETSADSYNSWLEATRRLTDGSFYRSDDAKAIVNPAEQFETRWSAAINSAKKNLAEWKSAFEDMQDYNERRGYSSKDIRGFGAGFLTNMSKETIEESTRQLFIFAEAMDFVASKAATVEDADIAQKGIADLIAPIGQYVAALQEITKQEDGAPFKPALEQLTALEAKLIATSEKLSGYWDKTADMGPAEKAFQAILDKVNQNLSAITAMNDKIKDMPDIFRKMEGDPVFEKLFGTMTDQQRVAMLDKWIDRINELGAGQKVKKITADVAELMRTLNDPQQAYMAERAGELMGLANPIDELRKSGIIQAFEKLGDISFSGSIEEINTEADIAAAQIDKLIGLIYELFAIEGTSDIPDALRAAAEEARRQLEENRERNIAAVTNRAASQRMQALEKELNKVKSVSEAYAGAADALKTLLMNPEVTAAQANVDREKIAQGELDRAGALSLMNEEQLRELDLKGALRGQQEELIELQLEAARLKSREYVDTQAQLSLLGLMLDNERARISYRERMNPRFQAQLIEAEHQKVLDEIQLNQLRMAYAGSEQGKSDFLALEIQKLEMERQNLEMQMLVMQDEKYRGEFLRLEMDKLAMESAVLDQKLELLRNPEFVQQERMNELKREEVALQELMNTYTVSFGQYLATNVVDAATNVSNALSGAFTDFITGARSMKDIFKDLLKGMIQGIISMFAQWAAQWLVALALQKLGMSVVTGTTTAAASAATAAWTPAAVAASIATMGAALGFGPPAIAMIAASGAMVGGLGMLGGAAPGGVTAPGGGDLARGAGLFHTGGMFAGNGGFGLKSDEGLAILQDGELIVRRRDVGATLAAMSAFNVPIPAGAKYHDGGIYGDDGMGKSFYGKLAGRQVQVVNYFDYADVERHLARNPDAILNVIQSDQRNNGVMRRNRG